MWQIRSFYVYTYIQFGYREVLGEMVCGSLKQNLNIQKTMTC